MVVTFNWNWSLDKHIKHSVSIGICLFNPGFNLSINQPINSFKILVQQTVVQGFLYILLQTQTRQQNYSFWLRILAKFGGGGFHLLNFRHILVNLRVSLRVFKVGQTQVQSEILTLSCFGQAQFRPWDFLHWEPLRGLRTWPARADVSN